MQVSVFSPGEASATTETGANYIELNEKVFSVAFNEPLVHQLVESYAAGGRLGTRAQKNRAAVRGGGIKPWRQKGTGRARAGTIRSPLWRGGGRVFPATTQDFSQKINTKSYRQGMRSIFSELLRQNRLRVIGDFQVSTPKTKDFLNTLEPYAVKKPLLLLMKGPDKNIYLSSRNLSLVEVKEVKRVDPISLIKSETVLMTPGAVQQVEEWLA